MGKNDWSLEIIAPPELHKPIRELFDAISWKLEHTESQSAQQKRKRGKWINRYGKPVEMINGCPAHECKCSVCDAWLGGSDEYSVTGKYCPNCGADMRGKSDG